MGTTGRWRALGAGSVLASAALLAGCGGGSEAGGAAASPSGPATVLPAPSTPSGTPSPTPTPSARPTPSSIVPTNLQTKGPIFRPLSIDGALYGADISWPQCPPGLGIPHKISGGAPLPTASAQFVIVGLTNGPGFYPNPCLADQVAFVRERGVLGAAYAVASYPDAATLARYGSQGPFDGSDRLGALQNVGYQQARFNLASMTRAGLTSPVVWIDVEPVPYYAWSSDTAANAAVVQGAARGYRDAGFTVGVYSTPALWQGVVGDLRLGDDVPEWRAAGQTSEAEAVRRCGPEWTIQGGPGVLGQWVAGGRDLNLTCPGVSDVGGYLAKQE